MPVIANGLVTDLPRDLLPLVKRRGTDARCRVYLMRSRWPHGFAWAGCGHGLESQQAAGAGEDQVLLLAGHAFLDPAGDLVVGLAKRWLLGTHHGAVSKKHRPADLDAYVFRINRRPVKASATVPPA